MKSTLTGRLTHRSRRPIFILCAYILWFQRMYDVLEKPDKEYPPQFYCSSPSPHVSHFIVRIIPVVPTTPQQFRKY